MRKLLYRWLITHVPELARLYSDLEHANDYIFELRDAYRDLEKRVENGGVQPQGGSNGNPARS